MHRGDRLLAMGRAPVYLSSGWHIVTIMVADLACLVVWLGLVDWTTDEHDSSLSWMGLALIVLVYAIAAASASLTGTRQWCTRSYGW
jgi:hypothetical protein